MDLSNASAKIILAMDVLPSANYLLSSNFKLQSKDSKFEIARSEYLFDPSPATPTSESNS